MQNLPENYQRRLTNFRQYLWIISSQICKTLAGFNRHCLLQTYPIQLSPTCRMSSTKCYSIQLIMLSKLQSNRQQYFEIIWMDERNTYCRCQLSSKCCIHLRLFKIKVDKKLITCCNHKNTINAKWNQENTQSFQTIFGRLHKNVVRKQVKSVYFLFIW